MPTTEPTSTNPNLARARVARSASIRRILVEYDGPQLLLLNTSRNLAMLGVAVEKEGMSYPLFCAELVGNTLDLYLSGKVDLNFVFRSTPLSRLYFADLDSSTEGVLPLKRSSLADAENEDFYPEPGLFSRSHTHPDQDEHRAREGESCLKFLIDGNWEAREFSKFYGKIADLYSFTALADDAEEISSRGGAEYLAEFISERAWQGGGSYLSFYGALKDQATRDYPLRVAGIEYHSPGYIEVVGDEGILERVASAIEIFGSSRDEIEPIYKSIYDTLKAERLLRATQDAEISSDTLDDFVLKQSHRLSASVGISNSDVVYASCKERTVIFAKVILSFTRRVRDLALFYAQGRVRRG